MGCLSRGGQLGRRASRAAFSNPTPAHRARPGLGLAGRQAGRPPAPSRSLSRVLATPSQPAPANPRAALVRLPLCHPINTRSPRSTR